MTHNGLPHGFKESPYLFFRCYNGGVVFLKREESLPFRDKY